MKNIDSYFPDIDEDIGGQGAPLSEKQLQEGFYNPENTEGDLSVAPPKSNIPIEKEGILIEKSESGDDEPVKISPAQAEKLKRILEQENI